MEEFTLLQIAEKEGKGKPYTAYLRRQIESGLLLARMIGAKVYVVRRDDYERWKANKPKRGQRRDYMEANKTPRK